MKKISFVFLLSLLLPASLMAQTLRVERFEMDPTDLTAVSHETLDGSGRPCALLKVMVMAPEMGFQSVNLVRSENKGRNEFWVWLSPEAENVSMQIAGQETLAIRFADHAPETARLKGKHTYVMVLDVSKNASNSCNVTFTCNAPAFTLNIDGYSTDVSRHTFPVPQGKHKVAATAAGYEDYTGEFELNAVSSDMVYAIEMVPTPTVPAEQSKLAEQYLKEGNYARALDLFQQSAKKNDPAGLNGMGDMYCNGYGGVEVDRDNALSYYKKAAKSGLPVAMYNVGRMLLGQKDWETNGAAKYYRQAAEAGYAEAYYGLACDFFYNDTKVMEFLTKGAEMGHAGCMSELARKLWRKKDYQGALKLYWLAADQGWAYAECNLASMYVLGEGVEVDYAKSFELRMRSFAHGATSSNRSCYNAARISANAIGYLYESGEGVEKDLELALTWYGIGARMGHEKARENYKRLYTQMR